MPEYEFVCDTCHETIVVRHAMTAPHPTVHANCGGKLRRKFSPTPVHYVHSGFFTTDKVLSEPEEE